MSYGIVRLQKFKASDVRGIEIHDNRERPSRTNPDIDQAKKAENYALVDSESWKKAIDQRLESLESKKAVRKDAVVMCQILVTSDSDFFKTLTPEQEKAFFQKSLDFIADRYGQENIVAATVHKDEKTPHMHVNFTPIREGKLSAKAIFDHKELAALHNDFNRNVGAEYGLQRGETREDKRRHQDVATFKRTTAEAELEKAKAELERTKAELDKTKAELVNVRGLQEGTAKALADAQRWSMEKARQEVERREKERERQAALERQKAEERAKQREISRSGPSMGR